MGAEKEGATPAKIGNSLNLIVKKSDFRTPTGLIGAFSSLLYPTAQQCFPEEE
jgi:hypothetical protein